MLRKTITLLFSLLLTFVSAEIKGNVPFIQVVEKPGEDGQYTTYYGDGTWKQYRGAGKSHGRITRPNIKEVKKKYSTIGW